MGYDHTTIEITAKGSAETAFTSATFTAFVSTHAETGLVAKQKAAPIIDKIKKVLQTFADSAQIKTDRIKTSFGVDTELNRNTGEHVGYKSHYSVTFEAKNVEKSLALHDALTSVEGASAPTPVFNIDNTHEVYIAAFTEAVKEARQKFEGQCQVVGIDASHYRISDWDIRGEIPRGGKFLSFKNDGSAQPIGLEVGKALLEMTVVFSFVLKSNHRTT